MGQKPIRIQFELPKYTPRTREWREGILKRARNAATTNDVGIPYDDKEIIELTVLLPDLPRQDVDNRLKDVMDALQGFLTEGGKKCREKEHILPNDNMVRRVIIEKAKAGQSTFGFVKIGRYSSKRQKLKF